MTRELRHYETYKESGVPRLGKVPEHWEVRKLRNVSQMRVSNVDKHTKVDEVPVRLCNYSDVYKNDHISKSIQFMQATATQEEIEQFRLRLGDVLITKDSEAWDDIGVPSLVVELEGELVCGYHLALLRPLKDLLLGEYLFRTLQNPSIAYQFHVEARGVTRYGLTHEGIKSVHLPLPSLDEQHAIVRFIDYVDRRIRRYIRAKRKLIRLLEEQKQAVIHQAVTRGLDPDAPLKDSGVEWLGQVPKHWGVERGKYFFREVDVRSTTGEEDLLSVSHLTGITPRSEKNITMFKAESYIGSKVCKPGQIAVNTMWAWMAAIGVSRYHGLISPSYHTYERLNPDSFADRYLDLLLRTDVYRMSYTVNSSGITTSRLRLYPDSFLNIRFLCPPRNEQHAILEWLEDSTAALDAAITRANREIDLLNEYRTRLIADVVTGKLDVRDAAASLPDESDEPEESETLGDLLPEIDEPEVDEVPEVEPDE
jgi:type I restriction enzyme S subunit